MRNTSIFEQQCGKSLYIYIPKNNLLHINFVYDSSLYFISNRESLISVNSDYYLNRVSMYMCKDLLFPRSSHR